jgi:hypothetical protein
MGWVTGGSRRKAPDTTDRPLMHQNPTDEARAYRVDLLDFFSGKTNDFSLNFRASLIDPEAE